MIFSSVSICHILYHIVDSPVELEKFDLYITFVNVEAVMKANKVPKSFCINNILKMFIIIDKSRTDSKNFHLFSNGMKRFLKNPSSRSMSFLSKDIY